MRLPPDLEAAYADSFVPPRPLRDDAHPSTAGLLRQLRRGLLHVFDARSFRSFEGGSLLRALRRRIVTANEPRTLKEALHDKHALFERKSPQMRHALEPLLGDGLFVSDGATWAERRAAVAPIVHAAHVPTFAPVMAEVARAFRDGLTPGAPHDMLFEMGEMSAEIIARTVFGTALGRSRTREIIAGFADFQRHVDQVDLPSMLGLPGWWPRRQTRAARAAARRVQAVIDGLLADIEARRGGSEAETDALAAKLFDAADRHGKPLARRAIRNEAIVLFMAGHETTANTLAWALYLVDRSPRVRAALSAELDAVLGGRDPEYADVPNLPVTRAIVLETLRLYPPVPILGRTATGDGTVGDHAVRAGDLFLAVPWLSQRNEDLWSLPHHFVPERFAPGRPRPDKHVYMPFASGPRTCPGQTFATVEAVLCLATLLRSYEIRLAPGTEVATDCRLTLRPTSPLTMIPRPRPC
ncbi:cytochrome P450 [Jannaschia sp. Os4]|uniref:cytochrome P450 n=1 Tax=Jannaschia sp. Os4 TaxID=2807617 RepID=UPI00193A4D0F|nr:cytochrome P450 [Jannaschia sp. Os4]MBM2575534.1 cytochrome P450 [Jannaschia sp. Os4]